MAAADANALDRLNEVVWIAGPSFLLVGENVVGCRDGGRHEARRETARAMAALLEDTGEPDGLTLSS